MVYPENFEDKIGMREVREALKERCLSPMGREKVDEMMFSTDVKEVNKWLQQVSEYRRIQEGTGDFPLEGFTDVRTGLQRIRLEGTHLEEDEVWKLGRSLQAIQNIVDFLCDDDGSGPRYPAIYMLTEGVQTFPAVVRRVDELLDEYGHMRDSASPALLRIRHELKVTENSISRVLYGILHQAQSGGVIEKDVSPTLRDGRLVIPVAPSMKRKIRGIVHDESASGKTVFVEPAEVVEANNRIRELEAEEKREVIRILVEFSSQVRPFVNDMLFAYSLLAAVDFIQAKAKWAMMSHGIEPHVESSPHIDWQQAVHPLLQLSLERQHKQVVPLDISLNAEKRILIISGPNAGGKSVCLKTVGLLQYMLQCGVSIPVGERTQTGIFNHIMIDMGDEQSIENDLSTYSSHLLNMKQMLKYSDEHTLLLIDEFGTGTEPQIGGAIAEALLGQFCARGAYGIITTHYQNLKHYADSHDRAINGAMLYDRHEMRPLFRLSIGQPGSSFAIEIARKIGLPESVIKEASRIVGEVYIESDKYLQDIVRDKRYWENKRQNIHQREKDLERTIARYEIRLKEIEDGRKEIMARANEQAEILLHDANKKIENVIREIREKQAEKDETRRLRDELKSWSSTSSSDTTSRDNDDSSALAVKGKVKGLISDAELQRRIAKMKARKERHEKRKAEKKQQADGGIGNTVIGRSIASERKKPGVGDMVRIKGLSSIGNVESIDGDTALVIFGNMRTRMALDRLERVNKSTMATVKNSMEQRMEEAAKTSAMTRETIDERRKNFRPEIDVRGMRGDEALSAVRYFIDDAILADVSRVRILHGKGNGILRQLIRDYLSAVPNVRHFADEHVQFGGAGITVVDL